MQIYLHISFKEHFEYDKVITSGMNYFGNVFQIAAHSSAVTGTPLIARFMGPTWGPPGDPGVPHVGHMKIAIWDKVWAIVI